MALEIFISIQHLSKKFSDILAVDDLSLTVLEKDIYGFLGPNGAGKSTSIRMLLSLISKDKGEIKIFNQSLTNNRSKILQRIGALIEKPDFYPYLSAYKNLELLSRYSLNKIEKNRIFEVLDLVGLKERAKSKVKTYSQGMRQRLGIAQSLLHNPDLLILDEPGNGLDPQGTKEIRDLILHLNKDEGKTIFISSHILSEVEQIANRMVILNKGKAIVEGNVADLLNSDNLKVKFVVNDYLKALQVIENTIFKNKLDFHDNHDLKFSLKKNEVGDLNKLFVENGIRVEAINSLRNLEEYFLEITNDKF